ncbi:hypothetical protein E2C01_094086 [Portunus trituberculatus]|uniref:Uncharacterized protein n=1 Tax=Portunus trituberculatus TaxID=210409 RepID=A0A5B7JWP1_PORTR|nr:hypothetical protein [Portunus trituberculatus]
MVVVLVAVSYLAGLNIFKHFIDSRTHRSKQTRHAQTYVRKEWFNDLRGRVQRPALQAAKEQSEATPVPISLNRPTCAAHLGTAARPGHLLWGGNLDTRREA